MIRPRPLHKGGRIGVCAPAGPVRPERLKAALDALRADGFSVVTSPSAFARDGLFSAPDEIRRRELEEMFARDDVDAVFCARGGVGSSRLLADLDTALVARSRKPFLGFSDVTALQWWLWASQRFVTFSGPLAVEWADGVSAATRHQALDMLAGESNANLLAPFDCDALRMIREGKARGRLLPGNLTMIATLLGTPYWPDVEETILLIEDVNEPPHRVDRLLFHLRNAGALSHIAGLLVGDLESGENGDTVGLVVRSLRDVTRGTSYPVAIGLPFGHGPERMTLPVGALAEWDSVSTSLSLCQPVTEGS